MVEVWEGENVDDEDWYGRDLSGSSFVNCTFVDVDLTESRSHGAMFEACSFSVCRFNASSHVGTAFVSQGR